MNYIYQFKNKESKDWLSFYCNDYTYPSLEELQKLKEIHTKANPDKDFRIKKTLPIK